MKTFLKRLTFNILPEEMLRAIKKVYYPYVLGVLSASDEADFKIINHLINNESYVVDIGANIGDYTKFFSELAGMNRRACI